MRGSEGPRGLRGGRWGCAFPAGHAFPMLGCRSLTKQTWGSAPQLSPVPSSQERLGNARRPSHPPFESACQILFHYLTPTDTFFCSTVRTLRVICICAEDYCRAQEARPEGGSQPPAAAM